jgi:hypothetical protein
MATRSALRVTRLGPADTDQLAALIDREPVTNVYLRSELRLGFEVGDWWGAFEDDQLTAVVLGWSLVVPYIPDADAAPPLAQALAAAAQPRMVVGHRASVMALHNAFRPPRPARELRDPQPLLILDAGNLRATPSPDVRLSNRADLEALILAAARMHREEMGIDPLAIDAPAWRTRMVRQSCPRGHPTSCRSRACTRRRTTAGVASHAPGSRRCANRSSATCRGAACMSTSTT